VTSLRLEVNQTISFRNLVKSLSDKRYYIRMISKNVRLVLVSTVTSIHGTLGASGLFWDM